MANPFAVKKAYFDSAQTIAEITRGDGWESLHLFEKESLREQPELVFTRLTAELADYVVALEERLAEVEARLEKLNDL